VRENHSPAAAEAFQVGADSPGVKTPERSATSPERFGSKRQSFTVGSKRVMKITREADELAGMFLLFFSYKKVFAFVKRLSLRGLRLEERSS
jgi:hypothetical protein